VAMRERQVRAVAVGSAPRARWQDRDRTAAAAQRRSRSGRRARRSALRSWHGLRCARADCHQRRGGAPRGGRGVGGAPSSAQGPFSTLLWGQQPKLLLVPSCFWSLRRPSPLDRSALDTGCAKSSPVTHRWKHRNIFVHPASTGQLTANRSAGSDPAVKL
jgi:hypothetical protein